MKTYITELVGHYEAYFGVPGKGLKLGKGPTDKLHPDFFILEFPSNKKNDMFCYCTVGMSADRSDDNLIELFVYSAKAEEGLIELLTVCASYHRNGLPLDINHTVNIGQPWLNNSQCDYGFISSPYLDGSELGVFEYNGQEIGCYWFIPITQKERDFKIEHGVEQLEHLFEDKQLDYLNPERNCLVG
ncbi:suppressor of fused domain protein [Pedobacter gandavensis]|uniref:suppressor of fused domain protein n=1 Tax=Pedobacter gandavensis TaxID=2679963 RepID=UPI00292EBD22|nr:suppressor of fused domain protein [Pedobacter gandavensis]